MLYLLAIFFPPLAVFLVGKPVQALINICLCILFLVPGIIHAWMVVKEHKADKRADRQTKALIKAQQKLSE